MFELILLAPVAQVEMLSDALDALDALSVSVEDADAHTPAEQALFGEPGMPPPQPGWERSRVVALFATEALAREAAAVLGLQDFFAGCQLVAVQAVPEQDWVRLTQSQFTPVEITPEFWIVPTWHEPPAQARQVIRLDPGLAFGTGTHPTTRMCLRWIAENGTPRLFTSSHVLSSSAGVELALGGPSLRSQAPAAGKSLGRVLDYGCGSGILAIGAAKFGALAIDAVDIDEAAVASTRANAQANHVQLQAGLPDKAVGSYQTVLANILATPLRVLAPLLCGHVQQGGNLVLAGILERQADELTAAYQPYCQLQVHDAQEGWILMTARF
ncbi:MAG: ribosomal protein L11P -lysine N-methyltransferase [Polaromonas sp.]|nr:ribosomal protein L11P -lysine N-methyltransferase [Polaromonas sp.]